LNMARLHELLKLPTGLQDNPVSTLELALKSEDGDSIRNWVGSLAKDNEPEVLLASVKWDSNPTMRGLFSGAYVQKTGDFSAVDNEPLAGLGATVEKTIEKKGHSQMLHSKVQAKTVGWGESLRNMFNDMVFGGYAFLGMTDHAADFAVERGMPERAIDLYLANGRNYPAAMIAEEANLPTRASQIWEQNGSFVLAGTQASMAGLKLRAVAMYEKGEKYLQAARIAADLDITVRALDLAKEGLKVCEEERQRLVKEPFEQTQRERWHLGVKQNEKSKNEFRVVIARALVKRRRRVVYSSCQCLCSVKPFRHSDHGR